MFAQRRKALFKPVHLHLHSWGPIFLSSPQVCPLEFLLPTAMRSETTKVTLFKAKCWYVHPTDPSQSNNSPASQQGGFQQNHQPFPPDQVALLMEMLKAFQLAKGNQSQVQQEQQRPPGV